MPQSKDDLSRSLVAFDQNSSLCAVIELSLDKWVVGAVVSGLALDPLKTLASDPEALVKLLHRWRDEAIKTGRKAKRMIVAFEAGPDGFWLACWLRTKGIEAYVIHPTSVPVSREQRQPRPTGWILDFCSAASWGGYGVKRNIAAWPQSRHSKRKTRSGRTASASTL
jgi:transposase